jgi:putative ABC transport system permease protein
MSWLHGLRDRLTALFRSKERDRELAEEIGFHIESEAARQMRQGHDRASARRRALERFGDPNGIIQATRDARGTSTPEAAMHDLRWAFRSLRKQPGFTALALVTLALGIGATTTAFIVLNTVLLRPLPYRQPERLVLMLEKTVTGSVRPTSYPNFVDWRDRTRSFTGVASEMFVWSQTVTAGAEPTRAVVMGVSRGFFSVLGVEPARGRVFTAEEHAAGGSMAVMVSWTFWKSEMNGRAELGDIRFGDQKVPVVGVVPESFRFIDDADLYFPHERMAGTCRSCHNYRVVARLAPGVPLATARAEMSTLSRDLLATYDSDTEAADVEMTPLREYLVGDYHVMLLIVFGAAAMVLLVACTNLISAQLARGLARGRELAVRAALGASRTRLARQLFLESGLLAIGGASLGTLAALLFTRGVRVFGTGLVPRLEELRMDRTVLLFVMAASVATALLIGVYPALSLASGSPGRLLRGSRGSSATVRASVWRLLVGFEVAMAIVLLIGSALLLRTLHNILTADTGFDARGLVTASLAPGDHFDLPRFEQVAAELAAIPGVRGAAFTNLLPLSWGSTSGPVRRPGDPRDRGYPALAGFRLVSPEYFSVLRRQVLKGRPFTAGDRAGTPLVAIVTPGIAEKLWPGQDPIGRQIATNYLKDQWLVVVGVVAEASSWTMPRGGQNEIFTPLAQHPGNLEGRIVAVIRSTGRTDDLMPLVRARLRTLLPEMPAKLGTVEEGIARSAADRRFAMFALTVFAGIALVLAAIGIYGTMAYTVAIRTHEIGVRMALGATPRGVRMRILGDAAGMALGGIAGGIGVGVLATRYLQSTLYGVSHVDALAYASGALVLLLAALLGAYVPARRSSRVDPMVVIRSE